MAVKQLAEGEGSQVLPICAKLEADIAELDDSDEKGHVHGGAWPLRIRTRPADPVQLFPARPDLVPDRGQRRVPRVDDQNGTKAPQAAGKIHSDFERGFIRAEVIAFDDLKACGTLANAKAKGLLRSEGKEYVMHDGDVVNFLFNV